MQKLLWSLCLVLLGLHPVFLAGVGAASWSSVISLSPVALLIKFVSLAVGVYVFLYWPVTQFAWTKLEKWPTLAFLYSAFLLTLPLAGLLYYLGRVGDIAAASDLSLTVISAVFASLWLFQAIQKPELPALFLSSAIFCQVFLVNEILSPFPTAFSVLAAGPFYWKAKGALISLALVLGLFAGSPSYAFQWKEIKPVAYGFYFFTFLLEIALPFAGARSTEPLVFPWLSLFLLPLLALLQMKHSRTAVIRTVALVMAGIFCFVSVAVSWKGEFSAVSSQQISLALTLGAIFLGLAIGVKLCRPAHRPPV
jgi:hypothetical protein